MPLQWPTLDRAVRQRIACCATTVGLDGDNQTLTISTIDTAHVPGLLCFVRLFCSSTIRACLFDLRRRHLHSCRTVQSRGDRVDREDFESQMLCTGSRHPAGMQKAVVDMELERSQQSYWQPVDARVSLVRAREVSIVWTWRVRKAQQSHLQMGASGDGLLAHTHLDAFLD